VVVVGSLNELAAVEHGAGSDERDQVWPVDHAPAVLGGLDELERHRQPGRPRPGPTGDLRPVPDRGEVDSIGFVVRRWIQCSAGKSYTASSTSTSSVIFATASGNLAM